MDSYFSSHIYKLPLPNSVKSRVSPPRWEPHFPIHYSDVMMGAIASQITSPRLFTQWFTQAQIKENIKAPRHWLCEGNSPGTGEFSAQMASNAENASIWWRHHEFWVIINNVVAYKSERTLLNVFKFVQWGLTGEHPDNRAIAWS